MKLIVQIPCFNEEQTLPETISGIPRAVEGFECVEIQVIDDGSCDRTVEVAVACGVDHIVRHRCNRGLAATFMTGIEAALRLGADVIVNTDGDNQYCGADIEKLVRPIVEGQADMVIGDREPSTIMHFSPLKRSLQRLGAMVARWLSQTDVADAVSGFRAFSRPCAERLNVFSRFSYTTETLIQAGQQGMSVVSVPVRTNAPTRESRLFRNMPEFLLRSGTTMVLAFVLYRAMKTLAILSGTLFVAGLIPISAFLYRSVWLGDSAGHIQSLVLGSALVVIGSVLLVTCLIVNLQTASRRLLEDVQFRIRRLESQPSPSNAPYKQTEFNNQLMNGKSVNRVDSDEPVTTSH
tara:strand:- start:19446 stop:20495 length:1050 start_codon:yes stop_codon:yes gene_type:complete